MKPASDRVGLTTQQAAARTGRSRSTIWRAIKTGRISASRSLTGDYLVEPFELARAFGPLAQQGDARDVARATGPATAATAIELALLRARVAALEADKEDLRGERDRLLAVIERQTGPFFASIAQQPDLSGAGCSAGKGRR